MFTSASAHAFPRRASSLRSLLWKQERPDDTLAPGVATSSRAPSPAAQAACLNERIFAATGAGIEYQKRPSSSFRQENGQKSRS